MDTKFLAIIGTWILTDGWYSLALYWGKPDQRFLRDHSIRIIRIILGIILIILA